MAQKKLAWILQLVGSLKCLLCVWCICLETAASVLRLSLIGWWSLLGIYWGQIMYSVSDVYGCVPAQIFTE